MNQLSNQQRETHRIKTQRKHYSRFGFFKRLPATNFDAPCISNSGPYVTEEEKKRKEMMESKTKWIAKKDFKSCVNKADLGKEDKRYIKNYVSRDPSEPPALHKFRETYRGKWLSGEDFKP